MNLNPTQQILWDVEKLYKATMELYENYFRMLEAMIEKTPTTEVEWLKELYVLVEDGQQAMEEDMALFDKAIATDTESLNKLQENLQIEDIYKKLKK